MFRPMLATAAQLPEVRYPVLASPKVDGIRAIVRHSTLLSRKLLPIPNQHLQELFGRPQYEGFDGEIVLGDPARATVFETADVTMEADMPANGVSFLVFDAVRLASPYRERYKELRERISILDNKPKQLVFWEHKLIFDEAELLTYVKECTDLGYEGLIIRDLNGPYKMGRSTVREGWMLKIKNFADAEAIVMDMEELMHNLNPAETNELGLTKRSSHQENKIQSGMMGSLVCAYGDVVIKIGTGFTEQQRRDIWENKAKYLRRHAKFKFQVTGGKAVEIGGKGIRPPYVFLGWRHELDMDAPSVESRAT